MPDVKSVKIDFEAKTATLVMLPGKQTDRRAIEDTLRPRGYGVTSFEEQASASAASLASP